MWTSSAGNEYLSFTSRSALPAFEMRSKNLTTRHLPGEQDHTHIAEALQSATEEWGIDLPVRVTVCVTDNDSNSVKSIEDDLHMLEFHVLDIHWV